MSRRKPPSQRDTGYALTRMSRTLQSMVPGTMGGRVANASPISFSSGVAAPLTALTSDTDPSSGAVKLARQTTTYTTGSLTAGAYEQGNVSIGTTYWVIYIETDVPARVRLYVSPDDQARDAGRPITYDPYPGLGIVMDYLTSSALLAAPVIPVAEGNVFSLLQGTSVPITVTSVDGGPVVVTLTYLTPDDTGTVVATGGGTGDYGTGDYAGDFGTPTIRPGYAHRVLVTLDDGSTGSFGTHVILDANKQDFHLHGIGVYAVNVSCEVLSGIASDTTTHLSNADTIAALKGMWLEVSFDSGGFIVFGAQTAVFDLAWDTVQGNFSHGVALLKTTSALTTVNFNFGIEGSLYSASMSVGVDVVKLSDDGLNAAGGGVGGGLDITTSAGGDNIKIRAPQGGSTTDVLGTRAFASIAVGDDTTVTDGVDVIAIGDSVVVAPIFTNTRVSDVIAIGDGVLAQVSDDVVAIGNGAVCMYPTKPNDTTWSPGDTVGTSTWTGFTSDEPSDMVAIGDGATVAVSSDGIAIGDGAVAMGARGIVALGSARAGTWLNTGGNPKRFRRVLPDVDCTAIGESATANGVGSIALGAATAGRSLTKQQTGSPMAYKQQSGHTAIGYHAYAGADVNVDVMGIDHATAIGASAVATHDHSTAIGAGAATTAANQVMLGTAADTVYVPGTLSAAGITGGGHVIAVANSGGTVTADVSTVEFTGTAVTSVTDDGGGHTTVTIHEGSGIVESIVAGSGVTVDSTDPANPIVAAAAGGVPTLHGYVEIDPPGSESFAYPYVSFDLVQGGESVAVAITLPIEIAAAGEGFAASAYLDSYSGTGTPSIQYAELSVTNIDATERAQMYTSTTAALTSGAITFDTLWSAAQIGADLSNSVDFQTLQSTAGGKFMATLVIEMQII